jgi:membrane-anchored glycerophosphoryl diester phosphodiesterase (GDPDase)
VAKPTILGKRITYKQNNIGKQTKKASQIFTNNSFTTFLEGDYLLGYVLFFFTMCMLIFFPLGYLLKMAMWAIANILQYFGKLFDYQIVCACDPSKIFFLFFCFFLTLEFIM